MKIRYQYCINAYIEVYRFLEKSPLQLPYSAGFILQIAIIGVAVQVRYVMAKLPTNTTVVKAT